jgi:hypothetical protein
VRSRVGALLAAVGVIAGALGLSSTPAVAAADGSGHNFLTGTVALSQSSAWVVGWSGFDDPPFGAAAQPEVLHWNGRRWSKVKTPTEGQVSTLEGVSATGPSDVWAVGSNADLCLIEHYNGREWASLPCPVTGGSTLAELFGVDARTRSDAWAVGYVNPGGSQLALAAHWNGHRWKPVATPRVSGSFVQLNSVVDLGPDNVLAVGTYDTKSHGLFTQHGLAERWNGRAWQRVSAPSFSTQSFLNGVSGGPAGVLAVGAVVVHRRDVPLIERWTGTRFVRARNQVTSGQLGGVTVLSKTSAYAVGQADNNTTLVERYNGKEWTRIATPDPRGGGYFASVAAAARGKFFVAAGWHGLDPDELPLIAQGNGKTWRITRA